MIVRKITTYDGDEIIDEYYEDFSWTKLRGYRDAELDATDWRAVKDRTMSQAWKDYRAFLRDLPQNFESANDAADAWAAYAIPE